ncbi:FtsW/RodA/SpoVE family cell cycle protein [Lacicoccus qingdaonensis]|uniref:Probable peptidoglycan glycosyltransferase FtsW n=1 Tax=Lacicoccus qingdaonensis TaxID=576118 RepID=A0A1G8ZZ77_9BACL|nr:FtsW/RodA/SpoVE family cell cycle protein [Salinicoccus qingdaonensis]SDK20422.1 cell division-specific peptidoglycan biosynthesis regulator FtsW [Salinicoccus qingdaonensis]
MQYVKDFFNYVKAYSKYVDFTIIIIYVLLSLIGLVMVYSSSMVMAANNDNISSPEYFYIRQAIFIFLGFSIVFFMSYFMSGEIFKEKKFQLTAIVIIMLLLFYTLFFGDVVNGQRNRIQFGPLSLQAQEFFKVLVIIYMAYIYDKKISLSKMQTQDYIYPLTFIGACSGLVLLTDFGTWMVVAAIIIGIFIYSGVPLKFILKTGLVITVAGGVLTLISYLFQGQILSDYQIARIETFINPFTDPMGAGYQLTNSLIAISHGGITGTGLGNGVMKLGYLPEPHTDFIFAVLAEELGLIGVFFTMILFVILIFKALKYAAVSKDKFYSLICVGVALYITLQLFVNIGGISKIIPLTGVPLPLLSYGGSAFLSVSMAVGLLIIAAKHVKKEKEGFQ